MITAADEGFHALGEGEHWQESYYFNWADMDGRAFGLARIGYTPRQHRMDGVLLTMRDGRAEFLYPAVRIAIGDRLPVPGRDELRTRRLSFRMDEPLSRWRIALGGRDEVDLAWTALTPAAEFPRGGGLGAVGHFEQAGRVVGHVRLKGRSCAVDALGQRDKSWGARDWGRIRGWTWIAAQFGDDFAFNATEGVDEGRPVSTGFVFRDGVNSSLTELAVELGRAGRRQVLGTADLVLRDERDRRYTVRARPLAHFPLVRSGLFIEESHCLFETQLDGVRRRGVGVVERAWHAGTLGTLRRAPDLVSTILDLRRPSRA
jgi:hypothetical protein